MMTTLIKYAEDTGMEGVGLQEPHEDQQEKCKALHLGRNNLMHQYMLVANQL